jgi:DNA polymerase I-like protein with 3'-5' exonuclease and polymerase domains
LQIHDELLVEVPAVHAVAAERVIKETLEGITQWNVPLVATMRMGSSWQEVSK